MYVVGEEGILKELDLAGFQYIGGPVRDEFYIKCVSRLNTCKLFIGMS